ncbi:O-antigen ligase family protein [Aquitalea pelogenes]|uniref:O-antigen ligase family protein n=1 Tax=Aquitalea pelogenes TaxID=1293573 RepID=UPI0009E870BC|nr:O-antigen ligase family protein [Aquitalea pelogenes]
MFSHFNANTWMNSRWHGSLVILLSFLFVATCSVSHTIALRYVLQACLLLLALPLIAGSMPVVRMAKYPILFLGLFMAYATLHTLFLSHWPDISRAELRSQLGIAVLWFFIGMVLFRVWRRFSIIDVVIAGGIALAMAEFCIEAYKYLTTGTWPYRETFSTPTYLEFTFLINFVLAFVVATLCFGHWGRQRVSRISKPWLLAILALFVFVSLHAAARNGMIGMVYLSFSMLLLYSIFQGVKHGWAKLLLIWLVVIGTLSGLVVYAIKQDSRNLAFTESVAAGWDYQHHPSWTQIGPLPLMSNGEPVDDSAFKRVAWIHSGLDMIASHPLGFGFMREVFAQAATSLGIKNNLGHAHSGFIDLGLALGVPGIVLWLLFCASLFVTGYRRFRYQQDVRGLMLMLMVCGFLGRMLNESIFRDHMLQLLLFVAGALLAEMIAMAKTDQGDGC